MHPATIPTGYTITSIGSRLPSGLGHLLKCPGYAFRDCSTDNGILSSLFMLISYAFPLINLPKGLLNYLILFKAKFGLP